MKQGTSLLVWEWLQRAFLANPLNTSIFHSRGQTKMLSKLALCLKGPISPSSSIALECLFHHIGHEGIVRHWFYFCVHTWNFSLISTLKELNTLTLNYFHGIQSLYLIWSPQWSFAPHIYILMATLDKFSRLPEKT